MINLRPTVCNLCGGKVIYIENKEIYGSSYGSGYCYFCTQCHARVGTHIPCPLDAKGILADDKMREAKISCHRLFDLKWKNYPDAKRRRKAAYLWLADQLDIEPEDCHFGFFDLNMLRKAYRVLLKDYRERSVQSV